MNSNVREELPKNEDIIFMRQNSRVMAQGNNANNIARCRVHPRTINSWLFIVCLALFNWLLSILLGYGF